MMRGLRSLLALLLLFVASACGEDATESTQATSTTAAPAATTTEPPTTTFASTTSTTESEEVGIAGLDFDYLDPETFPTLELVDAGSEPREVRSWAPPVGTVVVMTTTLSSASEQTAGGAEPMDADFTATIDATVEIVAETDEGFVAQTTFGPTSVSASDPLSQEALERAYAILPGVTVLQLTRPDGAIIAQSGIESLGGGNLLGNGLGGIATPLPTEPIGVGAVWRTYQVIVVEEIRLAQTVTTRLVAIEGDRLTVEIEASSAFDPDFDIEQLGSITLEGTSTGTAVWDLAIGMPVSASSESLQLVESTDPAAPFSVRTVTTIDIVSEPMG